MGAGLVTSDGGDGGGERHRRTPDARFGVRLRGVRGAVSCRRALRCCTTHDQRRLTTNDFFDPISSSGLHDVFIHAPHTSRGETNEMTETISRGQWRFFFSHQHINVADITTARKRSSSSRARAVLMVTFFSTIVDVSKRHPSSARPTYPVVELRRRRRVQPGGRCTASVTLQ